MRKMLEQEIEQQLVRAVKKMGGRAVKFMSPGFDGMPDRLVLLPGGKCGFVEVKAPGKKPRALQVVRHEMLKTWGFKVYVADAKEQIEEIINDIYSA
jgi:Holliday junction resolvase